MSVIKVLVKATGLVWEVDEDSPTFQAVVKSDQYEVMTKAPAAPVDPEVAAAKAAAKELKAAHKAAIKEDAERFPAE